MITQSNEQLSVSFAAADFARADKYDLFLKCKRLPESTVAYDYERDVYTISAHARYATLLGVETIQTENETAEFASFLFEHQRAITKLALDAKRFAVWADCGLGKTLIEAEFARQAIHRTGGRVLILTLNEVAAQTVEEINKFYGTQLPILHLATREQMLDWCERGDGVHNLAITNYEKVNPDKETGQIIGEFRFLDGLILDESSRLKSGGGKQKWALIKSSKGIPYKLSATATPAPNDVMEFASQASFLERMRSENEIIWTFFSKDEKSGEWTVKPHAREAFFEWMSAWSIYVRDPRTFGWAFDGALPPAPDIVRHPIAITAEQTEAARQWNVSNKGQAALFASDDSQGIVGRSKLSQIAKGFVYEKDKTVTRIESRKPKRVAELINAEIGRAVQTLVWTVFDAESEIIAEACEQESVLPGCDYEVLTGKTKPEARAEILRRFRSGELPCLISNAKLLGYGMNFQNCGAMIFSGWNDSFEEFYQAVRRAVRYGQRQAVRIHLPFIAELELAQLDNIFRKEARFVEAIEAQEAAYKRAMESLEIL